nr:urease accessory protein UreE [Pseudovibrio hongkongensis]
MRLDTLLRAQINDPQITPTLPTHRIKLEHDVRHLRRKVLQAQPLTTPEAAREPLLVDLPSAHQLQQGDVLVGKSAALLIEAAHEPLFQVTAQNTLHHAQLCWHLGNRHLPCQIEPQRILILRDHVIRHMLEGLGASLTLIEEPFTPLRGAYHASHSHAHSGNNEKSSNQVNGEHAHAH